MKIFKKIIESIKNTKAKVWFFHNRTATFICISIAAVIVIMTGVLVNMAIKSNKSTFNVSAAEKEAEVTIKPTLTPTEEPVETIVPEPVAEITVDPETLMTEQPTEAPTPEPVVETPKPKKTPRPTLKPELASVTVKPNDVEDPGNAASEAVQSMGEGQQVDFSNSSSSSVVENAMSSLANANTSDPNEMNGITNGIDVSSHNGNIDWSSVAASGVQFAMVRVGYRGYQYGTIVQDSKAIANIEGAIANGIKVGIYFFSTAMSEAEAIDEALWTCDFISKYKITYPVAYDCENYNNTSYRNYGTSNDARTTYALAFLNQVKSEGYTPMFYHCSYALAKEWNTELISSKYKIWKANYSETEKYYLGSFSMFQYTSSGSVSGISGRVDLNIAYFGYEKEVDPKASSYGMNFTDVNEVIYTNSTSNLRSVPSTSSKYTIKYTLEADTQLTRIGIGDNGWDKVIYNGETLYMNKTLVKTEAEYIKEHTPVVTPTPTPSVTPEPTTDPTVTPDPNNTSEPISSNSPDSSTVGPTSTASASISPSSSNEPLE